MLDLSPKDAFDFLAAQPDAVFVDCRSEAEFLFVGHPLGAVHVPWAEAPDWDINPSFVSEVRKLVSHSIDRPVVLICRSGNRSVHAGRALEAAGFSQVINVLHGFEGSLNEQHHRGELNGWRHDQLPWEQL
jgi:rhodanese-related sulfurtransferase